MLACGLAVCCEAAGGGVGAGSRFGKIEEAQERGAIMEHYAQDYLQKRPYRKKHADLADNKILFELMEKKFSEETQSYWESFGYEIGGPVCYAYVKWIIDEIEQKHPEITDLAFVARDGWLLQKVFEKLPHRADLKGHYIYAPRSMNLLCQNEDNHATYRQYLSEQEWGNGSVAVVDTVTMKFSSQRLIASSIKQETHGFFWVVLDGAKDYGEQFRFSTYQSAGYHTIDCWNLMEFIMTSPEPPIRAMQGNTPIYRTANTFELQRGTIFTQIEAGVMQFVEDLCCLGSFPVLSNAFITKWVNAFLKHPNLQDKTAFENIMFSEQEDHADSIPLNPFGRKELSLKSLKDRLWLFSQRHKNLHRVLHAANIALKKARTLAAGRKHVKFDGKDPRKLVQQLLKYDVVSFDIFDTLISRKGNQPTDLFYKLEEENGLFDFHDVRILCEAAARRNSNKSNGEINIFDIYQEGAQRYSIDAEKMVQVELAAEKETCYANPQMKEVYRLLAEKNCRMIAVSDMYIPEKYLRELLDGCGYSLIEKIFVSCDYGVNKGNGALQKLVQSELGSDLRCVHVGDNFNSDVQGSITASWDAVWYRYKYVKQYNQICIL